jgi:hypothetical protein
MESTRRADGGFCWRTGRRISRFGRRIIWFGRRSSRESVPPRWSDDDAERQSPGCKTPIQKARRWTVAEGDAIVAAQQGRQSKARWHVILERAAFPPDTTITADGCQARFATFRRKATLGDTLQYTALSDGLKKLWKEGSLPNEGKLLAALNARI